jgi:choline-glycine betaine transporter
MLANDALDRFGTTLEQRFSKTQITEMLFIAGFDVSTLIFSDSEPFWTFAVQKSPKSSMSLD